MRVNFRSINRYRGPVIYGTRVIDPPGGPLHAERAFWLTGQVETGNRIGSVMMADGTGFTIGIDQHIAVYPRELASEDFNAADDQGGAWALLAALEAVHAPAEPLWNAFYQQGWYVAREGSLRWMDNGKAKVKNRWVEHHAGNLVHGAIIRDTMTPIGGSVIKADQEKEARKWALLLHELTSAPESQGTQIAFGVNHLCHRIRTRKLRVAGRRVSFQNAVYGPTSRAVTLSDIGEPLDLALCVFHSYTVNAPSVAFRIMEGSIKATGWSASCLSNDGKREAFARDLLRRIKNKRYGFWSKRWKRTRKAAMEVGWWDRSLFRQGSGGIMTP